MRFSIVAIVLALAASAFAAPLVCTTSPWIRPISDRVTHSFRDYLEQLQLPRLLTPLRPPTHRPTPQPPTPLTAEPRPIGGRFRVIKPVSCTCNLFIVDPNADKNQ